VGPVRSGRTTDPKVLVQFGHPVMGYAGGQAPVVRAIDRAGVIDMNYDIAISAYSRDDSRAAPHNLYTSTRQLWKAAKSRGTPPPPPLSHSPVLGGPSRTPPLPRCLAVSGGRGPASQAPRRAPAVLLLLRRVLVMEQNAVGLAPVPRD